MTDEEQGKLAEINIRLTNVEQGMERTCILLRENKVYER